VRFLRIVVLRISTFIVADVLTKATAVALTRHIEIVLDGPPGPESGRFVEVEDEAGRSVGVGDWIDRQDGYWTLRIEVPHPKKTTIR
jgi:hypothetical protein